MNEVGSSATHQMGAATEAWPHAVDTLKNDRRLL